MDAKIIAIGNSKGLRLPRAVLDRLRLSEGDPIAIEVTDDHIVLRPGVPPRAGWAQRFAANPAAEDLWGELPADENLDR
jgi:antitoxin MazE